MHSRCGGTVSRKTLVCDVCHKKPRAIKVILVRPDTVPLQSLGAKRGYTRRASRNFEILLDIVGKESEDSKFRYPHE